MTMLNYAGAAKLLGVSPRTVRRMVKSKTIPHNRLRTAVVFNKESLELWQQKTELGKIKV